MLTWILSLDHDVAYLLAVAVSIGLLVIAAVVDLVFGGES